MLRRQHVKALQVAQIGAGGSAPHFHHWTDLHRPLRISIHVTNFFWTEQRARGQPVKISSQLVCLINMQKIWYTVSHIVRMHVGPNNFWDAGTPWGCG